jgi:Icc-related predicted phosphoesterase
LTHGPPHKILDHCKNGVDAGSISLRKEVLERIKPLYHIFGHIHETYGQQKIDNTIFINASSVNYNYHPVNKPIVFELPSRQTI